MKNKFYLSLLATLLLVACTNENKEANMQMNQLADKYVKLVLEIGQYNPVLIDAYYGPEEWLSEAKELKKTILPAEDFIFRIETLEKTLSEIDKKALNATLYQRHSFLKKQLIALKTNVQQINGESFNFLDEAKLLYDADVEIYPEEYFDDILNNLKAKLKVEENLIETLQNFRDEFIIPEDKIDTVFKAAIAEARKRTLKMVDLPLNENFTVELVKNEPWGAYNWYKGNNFSLIQVNTDLPIYIDRAIDLAAHEGYPGHHVYNCLLESKMVKENGWKEFSIYPLFSPQSLIAEGTANYGISVIFPIEERIQFEKEVLWPLAGLDASKVETYYQMLELLHGLSHSRNKFIKEYLDGEINREEAVKKIQKYGIRSKESAQKSLAFAEKYRSYVINYNVGQDMVQNYIEENGGTSENPEKRKELFIHLISTPQTASMLQKQK